MSNASQLVFKKFPGMRRATFEWPTIALSVAIYLSWILLTTFHAKLPTWLLFSLGGLVIAWHSSFQHEVVHGHPTRSRTINTLFGYPPLSLWLPFEIYRTSHRLHHKDDKLTDPLDDPESKYLSDEVWNSLSPLQRLLETLHTPLLGRVLLGPFFMISRFLSAEFSRLASGDLTHLSIWLRHGMAVSALLTWLNYFCGLNPLQYFFFFVYPGTAILVLRSFAEHRAAEDVPQRTAIVENASFFGLVFLNNNLHSVHHRYPGASWYALPTLYRVNRAAFLAANNSLVYNGYGDIIRRFLFTGHDEIVHPFFKAPNLFSAVKIAPVKDGAAALECSDLSGGELK